MDRETIKFIDSLIGIPYVLNGRSVEEGLDCFGLVVHYYREKLGIDLEDVDIDLPADWFDGEEHAQYKKELLVSRGAMVEFPQPNDLVLMGRKTSDKVNHIGIYLGENKVLHTTHKQGSTLSEFGSIKRSGTFRGVLKLNV